MEPVDGLVATPAELLPEHDSLGRTVGHRDGAAKGAAQLPQLMGMDVLRLQEHRARPLRRRGARTQAELGEESHRGGKTPQVVGGEVVEGGQDLGEVVFVKEFGVYADHVVEGAPRDESVPVATKVGQAAATVVVAITAVEVHGERVLAVKALLRVDDDETPPAPCRGWAGSRRNQG